jgi:hypothetical protein
MKRGGAIAGRGTVGTAYIKPDLEMEALLPEGCTWKDGYVMKVFEKRSEGKVEWKKTQILRDKKPAGAIYPEDEESHCILKNKRYALFSRYGGRTIFDLFYMDPGDDPDDALFNGIDRLEAGTPLAINKEILLDVLKALQTLEGQVKEMNANGIFHSDLTVENVVYQDGVASLIDFGYVDTTGDDESISIREMIDVLGKLKGGATKSRRKAVSSKRRTRRRSSYRSR